MFNFARLFKQVIGIERRMKFVNDGIFVVLYKFYNEFFTQLCRYFWHLGTYRMAIGYLSGAAYQGTVGILLVNLVHQRLEFTQ